MNIHMKSFLDLHAVKRTSIATVKSRHVIPKYILESQALRLFLLGKVGTTVALLGITLVTEELWVHLRERNMVSVLTDYAVHRKWRCKMREIHNPTTLLTEKRLPDSAMVAVVEGYGKEEEGKGERRRDGRCSGGGVCVESEGYQ